MIIFRGSTLLYQVDWVYISLDREIDAPIFALKSTTTLHRPPAAEIPYLIESRWPLWSVEMERKSISFISGGFGSLDMTWQLPQTGACELFQSGHPILKAESGHDGVVNFTLTMNGIKPNHFKMRCHYADAA